MRIKDKIFCLAHLRWCHLSLKTLDAHSIWHLTGKTNNFIFYSQVQIQNLTCVALQKLFQEIYVKFVYLLIISCAWCLLHFIEYALQPWILPFIPLRVSSGTSKEAFGAPVSSDELPAIVKDTVDWIPLVVKLRASATLRTWKVDISGEWLIYKKNFLLSIKSSNEVFVLLKLMIWVNNF